MKRAWILVGAVALVALARHRAHPDPCDLAQTWTAGDVHQYENLTLSSDHRGRWDLGSYDSEVEPDTQDFSWQASDGTLTFVADGADGERRAATYMIERMSARCRLSLDAYPLPRSHERTWYTGGL
jgi:hypothetical protein